jgi:transposase
MVQFGMQVPKPSCKNAEVKSIAWWQALHRVQKRGRENDRRRHVEQLERTRQRATQQRQRAIERLTAQHEAKLCKIKEVNAERETAYQQRIRELEAELSRCKGRQEKTPNAQNPRTSSGKTGKPKGKPKGSESGRTHHEELPAEIVYVELDEHQRRCPCCGKYAEELPFTADNEQVEWEVKLTRKRIRRRKYRTTCNCPNNPTFITASEPPRAMPGSKYSDGFWLHVLVRKFHLQIPLMVTIKELAASGLKDVKESTLLAGISRMIVLLMPIVDAIKNCCQGADLVGSDESRLSCFNASSDDMHNGYIWQHQCKAAVYFDFMMRRTGEYVAEFYRHARCILVVDRHKLYKCKAMQGCEHLTLAFCWNHTRNDFKELLETPGQQRWAGSYISRIRALYTCNGQRLEARGSPRFAYHDRKLRSLLHAFNTEAHDELQSYAGLLAPEGVAPSPDQQLAQQRHQVLDCLLRHWEGLTVFVEHPQTPMDNNQTEREFIDLARYRRNCNGVFSQNAGSKVAAMLSLFATLKRNQVPVMPYLSVYFAAIAEHGGLLPEDELRSYHPWALSADVQARIDSYTESVQRHD